MNTKRPFLLFLLALTALPALKAQTNLQVLYDLGKDRELITTTLEGFYEDDWGNTFFFIDYDHRLKKSQGSTAPDGAYMEIARALNFWKGSKLEPLSLHVEYNGGIYSKYGINHAILLGAEYFIHDQSFENTLTLQVLFKHIAGVRSQIPMQLTAVWGMEKFLGVEGLSFLGFADLWWEDHDVFNWDRKAGDMDWDHPTLSRFSFQSEPQIWYNVGRHMGIQHLHVGGEAEISYDFGSGSGFWCRPCLGIKWVF